MIYAQLTTFCLSWICTYWQGDSLFRVNGARFLDGCLGTVRLIQQQRPRSNSENRTSSSNRHRVGNMSCARPRENYDYLENIYGKTQWKNIKKCPLHCHATNRCYGCSFKLFHGYKNIWLIKTIKNLIPLL